VGCGRNAGKQDLVRLALCESDVVVDRPQRMPGRGAYVCDASCLARAARGGGLPRAFRRPVSIDAQTVESIG
jgi:predicted RNA-binding protein YlxR (DUF448 family)